MAQVFFCEFCETSKKPFSYRTPPVAASVILGLLKIARLNFTMNILTMLACDLKINIGNRLFKIQISLNPILMISFFTIK